MTVSKSINISWVGVGRWPLKLKYVVFPSKLGCFRMRVVEVVRSVLCPILGCLNVVQSDVCPPFQVKRLNPVIK